MPQGSNLGPLLFILYINDLSLGLQANHLFFADDLKLFRNISSVNDCILLQELVDAVGIWCTKNQLPINIDKCKVCSFTLKQKPILFEYNLNLSNLSRTTDIKDLGIYFDSKLSFSNHINHIADTAFKTLGFIIRNASNFSNISALKALYFSLVRSRLEYASIIWYPYYQINITVIERVQRRFLKFLSYKIDNFYPDRGYNHNLLLERFNCNSLYTRRILSSLAFLFKIFHNLIDSSSILSKFNIRVPRPESRMECMFYNRNARTNIQANSPIYIMSYNFNCISNLCDINACTLKELLAVALEHFGNI